MRPCCATPLSTLDERGRPRRYQRAPTTVVTVVVGELRVMEVEKCDACAQALVDRISTVDNQSPFYGARVAVRPIGTSRSDSPTTRAA